MLHCLLVQPPTLASHDRTERVRCERQALYAEALEALPETAAAPRAVVHANAAAAHLKLEQWAEAARAASAALEAAPGHEKALLRRAAAYEALGDLERALADYQAVRGC